MNGNAVRKGSYVLIIELKNDEEIEVGKLGTFHFGKGYYAYVGSAMNGIDARIGRHMRHDKKKHWHIDYLLEKGIIRQAWYVEGKRDECKIARSMEGKFNSIAGFGSSDCRCRSHLFYSKSIAGLVEAVEAMGLRRYSVRMTTK